MYGQRATGEGTRKRSGKEATVSGEIAWPRRNLARWFQGVSDLLCRNESGKAPVKTWQVLMRGMDYSTRVIDTGIKAIVVALLGGDRVVDTAR
jgi:hypothetical protein